MSKNKLEDATVSGDLKKVKSLLASGTNIPKCILQKVIFSGWAEGDDIRIIEMLVDAGADVNAMGKSGTPLYSAAMVAPFPSRSLKVTEFLLEAGADPNLQLRESPLHLAVTTIGHDTVARLIKGGADINAIDNEGKSVLHRAAYAFYELVGDPDEEELEEAYETAEMYVLNNLKPLLAAKPDQSVKDEDGDTALEAVFLLEKYPEGILEMLLAAGGSSDVTIKVSEEERVNLAAAMIIKNFPDTNFSYETIIDCIKQGNDIFEPVEVFGDRSLLEVVVIQMPDFAMDLFRECPTYAQVLTSKTKASMLHLAVFSGSKDLVELLLELKIDPALVIQEGDNKGKTALEFGTEKEVDDSILSLLR